MGFSDGNGISWTICNNLHLAPDNYTNNGITQVLQAGYSS